MTLGEAITRAHARGDAAERNQLLATARAYGVTVGAMCDLLGVGRQTAWRWSGGKHDREPCALSGVLVPNLGSPTAKMWLEIQEIAPASVGADRGRGTEPQGGPAHG